MADDETKTMTEIYKELDEEFPENQLSTRPVSGGRKYTYVNPVAVIRRLNDTCPEWSYETDFIMSQHKIETRHRKDGKTYDVEYEEFTVKGSLTIAGITREQYGGGNTDGATLGEAMKAAGTDALKKCAAMFGCALYLYGDDQSTQEPSNGDNGNWGGGDRNARKATDKQRDMLRAKAKGLEEIGNDELAGKMRKWADSDGLTNQHVDYAVSQAKQSHEEYDRSLSTPTGAADEPPPPLPPEEEGAQDDLPF